MPTSPIVAVVSGASFSVNTTAANLDPLLTVRDFLVLENGTLTLNPLSYTKVTQTSVSYSGPALAANTSLELRRSTPRDQRTLVLPNTKVRASDWNLEFDRRVRIQEEVDLYGAGGGFTVRLPVNAPYSVSWQSDTLFSPTRQALYNQMQLYAPLTSPVFTGTPSAPTPLTSDNSTTLATTAYVKSNLGNGAPLASPAFTGVPTVPTPLTSDNGTTIASTAYVKNNVALYLPLAGGTLTGLLTGTNANFSGNVTVPTQVTSDSSTLVASTAYVKNNLSLYGTIDNPTFTGNVNVPTAATVTNSTLVASTAYVKNNLVSFAPLASPALTGTPTAPTAPTSTSTTQLATTQFVQRRSRPLLIASRITSGQVLAATVENPLVWNNVIRDTDAILNTTTGVITLPLVGYYSINSVVYNNTGASFGSLTIIEGGTLTRLVRFDFRGNVAGGIQLGSSCLFYAPTANTQIRLSVADLNTTGTTFIESSVTGRNFMHMSIHYVGIDT